MISARASCYSRSIHFSDQCSNSSSNTKQRSNVINNNADLIENEEQRNDYDDNDDDDDDDDDAFARRDFGNDGFRGEGWGGERFGAEGFNGGGFPDEPDAHGRFMKRRHVDGVETRGMADSDSDIYGDGGSGRDRDRDNDSDSDIYGDGGDSSGSCIDSDSDSDSAIDGDGGGGSGRENNSDSDSDIDSDGGGGSGSGSGNDSDSDIDGDGGGGSGSGSGSNCDSDSDIDGDGGSGSDSNGDGNSGSGIEQQLIEFLADLFDNQGNWTWGCKNHRRDQTPLPNQQRVGPREWGDSRLQYLLADDGAILPDHLKADVLPREAGGTLPYQEVTDNMKKQAHLPFTHTERHEWLSNHGPAFKKMMTGDYGNGVQHLQFDIEDLCQQMEPQRRGKSSLFQTNDIDSGMGWLPSLGAIKTD